MKTRVIKVVKYTETWPELFQKEKQRLESSIDDSTLVAVHHMGSTSVPGLSAKPVIDILLEVSNLEQLDSYNSVMAGLGYLVKGESGIKGQRFYLKGEIERTHHIHAFLTGDPNIKRHLVFRDYLTAFAEVRQAYDVLKHEAAHICNNDIEKYIAYKHEFIKHHEQQALTWASGLNFYNK